MNVKRIDNWQEASNYKTDWDRLLSVFEYPTPFLTYDWLCLWWKNFGQDRELCLLVAEDDSGLQALAPFMISSGSRSTLDGKEILSLGFPRHIVEFQDNFNSCRMDWLTSPSRREEAVAAIFQYLNDLEWDILYLTPLAEDSPNLAPVLAWAIRMGHKVCLQPSWFSPHLIIEEGWENYFNSRSGNFRSFIKRKTKKLSQQGDLRFETFTQVEEVNELQKRLFSVADKGWAAKQETAISSTPASRSFYEGLTKLANQKGWLYCNTLSLNGVPIAFEYNLQYNQKIYNLKLGFDEKLSDYSPGIILKSYVLQEVFTRGFREYDFSGEDERYKMQFANRMRRHLRVFIFRNRFQTKWFRWMPFFIKEKIKMASPLRQIFQISSRNEWKLSVEMFLHNGKRPSLATTGKIN